MFALLRFCFLQKSRIERDFVFLVSWEESKEIKIDEISGYPLGFYTYHIPYLNFFHIYFYLRWHKSSTHLLQGCNSIHTQLKVLNDSSFHCTTHPLQDMLLQVLPPAVFSFFFLHLILTHLNVITTLIIHYFWCMWSKEKGFSSKSAALYIHAFSLLSLLSCLWPTW